LALEDGTDRLSRNVGNELPVNAAQYPSRAKTSQRDGSLQSLLLFV